MSLYSGRASPDSPDAQDRVCGVCVHAGRGASSWVIYPVYPSSLAGSLGLLEETVRAQVPVPLDFWFSAVVGALLSSPQHNLGSE